MSDSTTQARALDARLDGRALAPGDRDYDALRKPAQALVEQHPAVIAEAASADDVAAAIAFARERALTLAVTATGHGIAAPCDGGLLLHLGTLDAITVDVERRRATIGPGVTAGALLAATEPHGLTYPAGQVTKVGVTGYALGGGMGWLVRKVGPASASVVGADVVLADGSRVHASADEHAELLWALRGGGGNFGVVTALELALHAVPEVYGGDLYYPFSRAAEVLRVYREWAATLGDDTSTVVRLLALPVAHFPGVLRGLRAVMIGVCHADPDAGPDVLKPLEALGKPLYQNVKRRTLSGLAGLELPSHRARAPGYDQAEYVRELSDAVLDRLLGAADRRLPPLMQVELQQLGGALGRDDARDGAFEPSRAPYLLHLITTPNPLDPLDTVAEATRGLVEALGDALTGEAYFNYLRGDEQARVPRAFGEAKYARLRALRRRYDPDNVFRLNLNVPPAA